MTQHQIFHSSLVLFPIFLFVDGFRSLADILPQLLPWIKFGLSDFYAVMKWELPAFSSASHIVPILLPSFASIGFAVLLFIKADDLVTRFFPEGNQSSPLIELQPEECLR